MTNQHGHDPFGSASAVEHSAGSAVEEGALRPDDGGDVPPAAERVHAALRALILDPEFPCVGARSAVNQDSYRFGLYAHMDDEASIAGLARDLHEFVRVGDEGGEFRTFMACFEGPKVRDEVEFERLLWNVLRDLRRTDAPHHGWDPAVSSDPADPQFSFSFGGSAFFVVGLSPASSRWARTFPWPLMAFNPHEQFERLREQGRFERMQEVIRERDRDIEGDVNPNLSNFGEHTEARQYSGREAGPDWRCPVHFDA